MTFSVLFFVYECRARLENDREIVYFKKGFGFSLVFFGFIAPPQELKCGLSLIKTAPSPWHLFSSLSLTLNLALEWQYDNHFQGV